MHFLVEHYGRDGKKRTRVGVAGRTTREGGGEGEKVSSRTPRGEYLKGRTISRRREARNKKFALGGSAEIWISGREKSGRARETWLRNTLSFSSLRTFFARLSFLFLSLPLFLSIVLMEGSYRDQVARLCRAITRHRR